jgi:hypothetical protein
MHLIKNGKINEIKKVNMNKFPKYVGEGCPRHGIEYLVHENQTIYCSAPTPGEIINKCLYHVSCCAGRKPKRSYNAKAAIKFN